MILDAHDTAHYTQEGWWGTQTISDLVREHAALQPGNAAYIELDRRLTWADYDAEADTVAGTLVGVGLDAGDRVAILLPDSAEFHIALLGTERAGLVGVGVGARAGNAEIAHLVGHTGSRALVTLAEHRGRDTTGLPAELAQRGIALEWHLVLGGDVPEARRLGAGGEVVEVIRVDVPAPAQYRDRALGANDLWALNSTSGTTGMPKSVTQFQNRWLYFARLAAQAGKLTKDDVFFSVVPSPFGFGLWTGHFISAVLGSPAVVLPKFNAETMIDLIERERVTVLCCVSTQFRMLLNSSAAESSRLDSLRVMFTGGEAIPYERALEFERRTGASVLNFFGSNETGAFSYTTVDDTAKVRLTSGGSLVPEMDVRLFDDNLNDITETGGPGQPGGRGPLLCGGYYNDAEANTQLYTPSGHMLMGDLVTVDEDGVLRVVGRKSDLIIRGGKNISAAQVEAEVETHPDVELVSVVAVPDELYGERVCAVVSTYNGTDLTLESLIEHLLGREISKELLPERLVVLPELPRSSGGKIAKSKVRALVEERLGLSG